MDPRPELPPEEQDHIRRQTRRMVGVAALRRIQQLLHDYRDGKEQLELQRPVNLHPGLSPEEQALIQAKRRRMVGYIGLRRIQAFVREYWELQEAAQKTARKIAIFFAALFMVGALLYLVTPSVLEMLFRMLS